MAWGGGWGGGGGGFGGGPHVASSASNLPFGGIPTELQAGAAKLLADEPAHEPARLTFTQRPNAKERRRLTLPSMLWVYKRWVVTGSLLVIAISLLLQSGPKLTEVAINHGMAPGHHSLRVITVCGLLYLALALLGTFAQRAQALVTGKLASRVMHDLRIRVFTHFQRLSLDFFTEEKAGVLMSRMTSDIENLQQLIQDGVSQFALQGLTMIVITAVLFATNVVLATWTVVLIVPILFAFSLWFHHASERGYLLSRDRIANVLADLSESLYGIRVVTANNRQRRNIVNHRHVVGAYRDANLYTGRVNAIYGPATIMIGILGQGLLLGIGGHMVLRHQLSLGALIAFFLYLNRFFQPIQLLVQQYNALQQGRSSIIRLRELLETPPSVDELPDATTLGAIEGRLTFENVSFGYDPANLVLRDVNLEIAPGESVAFVGPTGAGKSTMAKLANRFYDPTAGRVLVDGVDVKTVTLHSLRSQLGVVPQEPFLFAGTMRQNLRFGRPEATDADLDEAVDVVGLRDLVERLPEGLDTVVHERGQTLSAGERQLLALARAFLARPRVLILDEATSSLDLQSETVIERALDRLLEGRSAILIAHRLTTAQRADRIVVIDHGGVVEIGSPSELLRQGGAYATMYEAWLASGGRDATRERA
ncbi:MAG: ABC transporter ATP-binding protein [Acidobacteriota bacterium]|nr:ABC transporter ATP-binding protein [Acidobacteriota bacterium]MDE3107007.1 ABC transporter ATP-binding protein [Acidobacteriota bacterium]MDE3222004.1 ABC transporter ATP-binding protein [Acidobacteriota bacterium]